VPIGAARVRIAAASAIGIAAQRGCTAGVAVTHRAAGSAGKVRATTGIVNRPRAAESAWRRVRTAAAAAAKVRATAHMGTATGVAAAAMLGQRGRASS
jgi:hypothetical protein